MDNNVRKAWVLGGGLLLASVVVGVSTPPLLALIGSVNIATSLFVAAALFVFAFGIRGRGSVTARRPLGTWAIAVLALVQLLEPFLTRVMTADGATSASVRYGYVVVLVKVCLATIGVTGIVHARIVPLPWLWAPVWALVAGVAVWTLEQLAGAADQGGNVPPLTLALVTIEGVLAAGTPVFLGALAIALGSRGVDVAAADEVRLGRAAPPRRTR